jgi:hypothetical protein
VGRRRNSAWGSRLNGSVGESFFDDTLAFDELGKSHLILVTATTCNLICQDIDTFLDKT